MSIFLNDFTTSSTTDSSQTLTSQSLTPLTLHASNAPVLSEISAEIKPVAAVLQNTFKNNKGMTLVEIMIVLAIIGTIIALLTGNLTGALDKSKKREAKIMLGQITQALQLYYTDCSKYPKSLEGLAKADSDCANWGPEAYYKKKKGFKDPWEHDLVYEQTTGGYILKSLGKDGKEGGTGFNEDISADESEDSKTE